MICPICGGYVNVNMILTEPPIIEYKCTGCGAQKEVPQQADNRIAPLN